MVSGPASARQPNFITPSGPPGCIECAENGLTFLSVKPSQIRFMSTEPISFGLIGAGGIGRAHIAALHALHSAGGVRFTAVADPFFTDAAARQELEALGVRWYGDYKEMLRQEKGLEAVTIATPIPLHFSMASACIEHGLFVLLEKPPAPLIGQLDKLIGLDREVRVAINFQNVHLPALQRIRRSIVDGKLGKLTEIRIVAGWPRGDSYYARAKWAGRLTLDGEPVFDGPATNALAHQIHNAMYLAALAEPGGGPFAEPIEIQGELYRARRIESYDVASLRGWFGSGVTFTATLAHAVRENLPFKVEARGTAGWARLSGDGRVFESSIPEEKIEPETPFPDLVLEVYKQFLDSIRGGQTALLTRLRDARGYVLATNGMWLSSGGIHDIDSQWLRPHQTDGGAVIEVLGLSDRLNEGFAAGKLLSELDTPWARSTQPVSASNLGNISFAEHSK